jgi:small conductance mechanosensitive channel
MQELKTTVIKFLAEYGFQIIGALIILTAGALVARWVGRATDQWFIKRHLEPPLRMLAVRLIRLLVFGLSVVLALDKCGVPITPLVAGIGVAGVGIGLATQGVLSNIVAGLVIIFTKPFRVGEFIELHGEHGQVQLIELLSTTLLHADRSRVIIPNRKIVGEILHNFGAQRQLNLSVGIGYRSNIDQALKAIREVLADNARVLRDPAPVVGVAELGDFSVNIAVKPWVPVAEFGVATVEINRAILEKFAALRIEIPFPQREVRILNGIADGPTLLEPKIELESPFGRPTAGK